MGSLTPAYDERTDPFSDRFAGRWGFGFTEVPFKTHSRYAGARFAPQYTTREWLDAVARSLMTARKANLLTDEQADRFLPVLLTEGGNPAFMTDAWWPGAKARNVLRTMGLQHYNETFAPDTATMRERLQRYAQGAVSKWVMFNQQYPDLDLATQRWNGAGIRTDASGQVWADSRQHLRKVHEAINMFQHEDNAALRSAWTAALDKYTDPPPEPPAQPPAAPRGPPGPYDELIARTSAQLGW